MHIITLRFRAFKQLSTHLCLVRMSFPTDRVPQKLYYKRVRSQSLLDLINVINLFHGFCALFHRLISLLKINFISYHAFFLFGLDMFCMVIS